MAHRDPPVSFLMLFAIMISLVALAIDIMLPALTEITHDLHTDPRNAPLIVSALFLGFAVGQLFAGPLSDTIGRKPVIIGGLIIFIIGTIPTIIAQDFTTMMLGRILQGAALAAPRIVSAAIIRDLYQGRTMARVMSVIMTIFILVPAIAPAMGQVIIHFNGWRAIFVALLLAGLTCLIWFYIQQKETLTHADRRPFSVKAIAAGTLEIFTCRPAIGHIVALGLIFGPFMTYLGTAERIYNHTYDTGARFVIYFAIASLAIGAGSILNARLVEQIGMRHLTLLALCTLCIAAIIFLPFSIMTAGQPPLPVFFAWLIITFFCMGINFGNLSALSMEPLGHMAGLGAAMMGAISTFIALPINTAMNAVPWNGVTTLVAGFAICGILSLTITRFSAKFP